MGEAVREAFSKSPRLLAPLQGLVRIAKNPQSPRPITEARTSRILSIGKDMGPALLEIVQREAALQVFSGGGKLTNMKGRDPYRKVSRDKKRRILIALGTLQA